MPPTPSEAVGGPARVLSAAELRALALSLGADDVGFVEVTRPEVADQRDAILSLMPAARTLISLCCRTNRGDIRSPARSVANLEFHEAGDELNGVAHRLVAALERRGIHALNPAAGFPMEMDEWPGRTWVISHKPVAVAAGLGSVGIHRCVIHPIFGSFILLATVVMDAAVDTNSTALPYNPCVECKLCVAACPTGAIAADGRFDFSACYTHNYREFMSGFNDWVESVVSSPTPRDYRRRVSDSETVSLWQSLAFGPNYKAAYCVAVCPAGEDVIGALNANRNRFLDDVVKPLQQKKEVIYAVRGADVAAHVERRFPNKRVRFVSNGLRPRTIRGFLAGLSWTFQRGAAAALDAVFHFTFTGAEVVRATVAIRDQKLTVSDGHLGEPAVRVAADAATWLAFLRKERSIALALLTRRIRVRGPLRLLKAFARCFPA